MVGALDAGYLDELVDGDVAAAAVERARRLGELPARAYASTNRRLRQTVVDELLAGLDADMAEMVPPA
jgi:hypothetical protein